MLNINFSLNDENNSQKRERKKQKNDDKAEEMVGMFNVMGS